MEAERVVEFDDLDVERLRSAPLPEELRLVEDCPVTHRGMPGPDGYRVTALLPDGSHVSATCAVCGGYGYRPTPFGREVLRLVREFQPNGRPRRSAKVDRRSSEEGANG